MVLESTNLACCPSVIIRNGPEKAERLELEKTFLQKINEMEREAKYFCRGGEPNEDANTLLE